VSARSIGDFAALAAAVEDAHEIKHENERAFKSHKRLTNSAKSKKGSSCAAEQRRFPPERWDSANGH